MAPRGSHPLCSPCQNLPPGNASPFPSPALFFNLTLAPDLVPAQALSLVSAPAPALTAINDLFKQFMKAYLEMNEGLR